MCLCPLCAGGRFSPFKSVQELLGAFELLGQGFKTHLVISGLAAAVNLEPKLKDITFSDAPPASSWKSKCSLRESLALLYPSGIDSLGVPPCHCVFELFGDTVSYNVVCGCSLNLSASLHPSLSLAE